jgi:hypothetical protein
VLGKVREALARINVVMSGGGLQRPIVVEDTSFHASLTLKYREKPGFAAKTPTARPVLR